MGIIIGPWHSITRLGSEGVSAEAEAFIGSLGWSCGGDDGTAVVTRAPGRLDVMGGIADYSGSLVLQLPLEEACYAALRRTRGASGGGAFVVTSRAAHDSGRAEHVRVPLSALVCFAADSATALPISWEAWAALKASWPAEEAWAAYVVGGLLALMHAGHIRPFDSAGGSRASHGEPSLCVSREVVEIALASAVPEGKGVSSSAAVEVATLAALARAFGAAPLLADGRALALCAQLVEHRAVGAPCGVMDQMASALGERGALMALCCQPALVEGQLALPAHLCLWGLDSGVRHSVGGSDYGSVRAAAFIGKALLSRLAAEPLEHTVHLSPSQLDSGLADALPEALTGAAFLAAHPSGHGDDATRVQPERSYAVRAAVSHPIREHSRVRLFQQLLLAPPSELQLAALGELMFQSHASYSSVGLGCGATDDLVRRARLAGAARGVYGAKITGGGSGGTVCVLTDDSADAEAAVREIARAYGSDHGGEPARIFKGSSEGAVQFGALLLRAAPRPELQAERESEPAV
jgi:L-arabinokinase